MSPQRENDYTALQAEDEAVVDVSGQSIWQSIWENNQGALLILLSEVFGSCMDATARYLQQGGAGFHTLQVGGPSALFFPDKTC